jgi:uncharacterized protein YndB with AHSA1/START domain
VHAAVEIAAPPDAVFQALTDPDELAAWWGSADSYRTRDWAVDARPGGRWSTRATTPAGDVGTLGGEFRVVDPPRALEYSWEASWDGGAPTVVRFELAPALVRGVPGTRLTVTHTGANATACAAPLAVAATWPAGAATAFCTLRALALAA